MAIKPITNMLRNSALMHIGIGISGGIVSGYAFWYGYHMPMVWRRDAWYVEQAQKKAAA